MRLHYSVARWCLGRLRNNESGAESIKSSLDFFVGEGVKKPIKMVAMFAPGFRELLKE